MNFRESDHFEPGVPSLRPTRTVLCVDDDPSQLLLTKLRLERAGYSVIGTATSDEARSVLSSTDVSAVVLDYWLRESKGTAFVQEIKNSHPDLPVIILSGFAPMLDERLGPADDWIVKGRDSEELPQRIARLLDQHTNQ